jgi:hypothetical protein
MKKFNILHNDLLNEDNLENVFLEIIKTPCDNVFEISISLEFELNNLEILDITEGRFAAFTSYLDSISL